MRRPFPVVVLGARPPWMLPLIVATTVSLVAAVLLADSVAGVADELFRPPSVSIAEPVPGTRDRYAAGVNLVVVLDESGSTATSDPWNARHDEVVALAEMLGHSEENRMDTLSILHFASTVSSVRGPFRPSHDAGEVTSAIRPPDGLGGGTDIPAALAVAAELCRSTQRPDALVLISDGQDDLERVDAAFRSSPCESANVLLLNADRVAGVLQPRYQSMQIDGLFRADTVASGTFAAALVGALSRFTGQEPPSGGWVRHG